jgi:drug/metabolite transporter (DMT)-like permease
VTSASPSTQPIGGRLDRLGPAILAAVTFSCSDILGKLTLNAGAGVLTLLTVRSFVGIAMMATWLTLAAKLPPLAPRARKLSWLLGILFTANIYLLFKAFEVVPVPIAILTFFTYPLLTGIAGAMTGLDRLSWRGAAAALAAFLGLALMLGAHPGGLALVGILAALASAGCRVVMLLITRAWLQDADARLITWHSLIASTVLFTLLLLTARQWQPPAGIDGWAALVGLAVVTTLGIMFVYMSTARIGPFRTALFMNLEPLLTAMGSAMFLGEILTPLQVAGGAVMLAALVLFQLKR